MSTIEWTDQTWNPVRGCSRVSAGCTRCYAERMAARYSGPGLAFEGFAKMVGAKDGTLRGRHRHVPGSARWTGRVELIPSKLDEPLHWRKPSRVFVNSMSDLFHETLPFEHIESVFRIMVLAERHTFQVLTKRPERMREFCLNRSRKHSDTIPSNIWLGVSVEDQATADQRIPPLLQTPAAVRFVSLEPMLGPVSLDPLFRCDGCGYTEMDKRIQGDHPLCKEPTSTLDWVIVGGESGPGARPFDLAWARSVIAQGREAGVPCFVKQLGARAISSSDDDRRHCGDMNLTSTFRLHGLGPKGGNPDEWPEDLRVREFPATHPGETP